MLGYRDVGARASVCVFFFVDIHFKSWVVLSEFEYRFSVCNVCHLNTF